MKKFHPFYFFFFYLVFFVFNFSVNAQEQPKDQLFWIHEEKAKVNMLDQYSKTSKDMISLFKEGGINTEIRVSQRDDNLFFYLVPISNHADIDTLYGKFGAAQAKVGKDKWSNAMKENSATIESTRDVIAKWSGKYSYVPKNPRIKQAEINFIHWDYFTVLPEKRKEFFDIAKKFKELYEKNDIGMGFGVWIPDFGFDNDLVVVTEVAKDDIDYYQAGKMINEKLGKDGEMLWNNLLKTLKNFEHYNGHPRRDLSMLKGKM